VLLQNIFPPAVFVRPAIAAILWTEYWIVDAIASIQADSGNRNLM